MKKLIIPLLAIFALVFLNQCTETGGEKSNPEGVAYGQFKDKVEWGRHLVTVSGCHDCHSPKVFNGTGMDLDSTMLLSGHHAGSPEPDADLQELRNKGTIVTVISLTSWAGPWGVSYTGNLTSDETGIGNWTEEQFMTALRKGKYKGLENARDLLPPMPWQMYQHFTDEEISAIFAYLKSTNPVRNVVPSPRSLEDQIN